MMENRKHTGGFVSYLRVSTDQQGISGLGLEAQREAVRVYLNGGDWHIVTEFVEVESGRNSDRPVLAQALAAGTPPSRSARCGQRQPLDPLGGLPIASARGRRRRADSATYPRSRVQPAGSCCRSMAAVAELEAGMISKRTKDALAAAKARGVKIGGDRGQRITPEMSAAGRAANTARAKARANDLAPLIAEIRAAGITSLGGIGRELVARGVPTATGSSVWQPVQVQRVLRRLDA